MAASHVLILGEVERLRFSVLRDLYIFISILIWMSYKAHQGICERAGFSAVPAVFLDKACFGKEKRYMNLML